MNLDLIVLFTLFGSIRLVGLAALSGNVMTYFLLTKDMDT